MAGRSTSYNKVVDPELWEKVSKQNKRMIDDFAEYNHSVDRSDATVNQYTAQLKLFFVWNLQENDNKFFVDIKKRDFVRFFGYLRSELHSSPNRIISMKAVLSSLSNYIERMLDDEYPNYRNVVRIIESPAKVAVREKAILSEQQVQDCLKKLIDDKKYQLACFFALAIASGARKAELMQFKCNYFTDENIVYGCLYETPEDIRMKGKGKLGHRDKKYTFVKLFKPYFELWMEDRKEKGIDTEELFVVYQNGQYRPATAKTGDTWAKTIEKYLGCEWYCHAGRHYWTTYCKKQGLPDDIIMKLQSWQSNMVSTYDDREKTEGFEKYFGEDGIKKVKETTLEDM